MILETIKDQEYHKKILLANDSYAEIERKEGTQLIINVDYNCMVYAGTENYCLFAVDVL